MPIVRYNFPLRGIYRGSAVSAQPDSTAYDMNNVRPYDTIDNRSRGGQRPGLDKWGDGDSLGSIPVVSIKSVSVQEIV